MVQILTYFGIGIGTTLCIVITPILLNKIITKFIGEPEDNSFWTHWLSGLLIIGILALVCLTGWLVGHFIFHI